MGDELIHKRGESVRECLRERYKGMLPMSINSTHFLKLLLICEPYILLLSVPKANY
jgi:hypothetical protein